MGNVRLGRLFGLEISADWTVLPGLAVIWVFWSALAIIAFGAPTDTAIAFGILAVALHWLSDLAHQLGHAHAAHATGFPATGIHFWTIFSTTLYPATEPSLPAAVHIRRALGGPLWSAAFSLVGLIWVLLARDSSNVWRWLALFFLADNLVIFTLQAAIPMGFNDGATLWRWMRRRSQ